MLEAVYVESLKLVLMLDESGHTQMLDKIFADVKTRSEFVSTLLLWV
jgi:hypothetical protein